MNKDREFICICSMHTTTYVQPQRDNKKTEGRERLSFDGYLGYNCDDYRNTG